MLKNGTPLFCRCGCGQETATVKRPPGSVLKSKYFGVVKGHVPVIKDIVDAEGLGRRRVARYLIGMVKGWAADRYGRTAPKQAT